MTNMQIKKLAHELFEKYTGIKTTIKSITLLEADVDGSYIFFAVGKMSFAYYRNINSFVAYPNMDGTDGMKF
jgi:hypothetical protein